MPAEEGTINNQWILNARPKKGGDVVVDPSIFSKRSQPLPDLKDGQVLAKVLYISFDPANRGWIEKDTYDMPAVPVGDPVRAIGVAQVVESKHKLFRPGDIVNGLVNWQEYVVFDPDDDKTAVIKFTILPGHFDPLRMLVYMPAALSAWFGMHDLAKIKPSDAVLVSGAAGATGSVAGQIAKLLHASKVVGIDGGPEKCEWLTSSAGFDAAIDYMNENVSERLKELFPKGVNVFFDNVGGRILDTVLLHLAHRARIVLCGAVSLHDLPESEHCGLKNTTNLIAKSATAKGFMLSDYKGQFLEGILALDLWVKYRHLLLKVDEQEGFDNIPATLIQLLKGANTGKQVLKLCDPPLPLRRNWLLAAVLKGLSICVCLKMLDKLWLYVKEREENKALGKVETLIATETKKSKTKEKKQRMA